MRSSLATRSAVVERKKKSSNKDEVSRRSQPLISPLCSSSSSSVPEVLVPSLWTTSSTGRRTAIGSRSRTAIDSKRTPSVRGSANQRAYVTTGADGENRTTGAPPPATEGAPEEVGPEPLFPAPEGPPWGALQPQGHRLSGYLGRRRRPTPLGQEHTEERLWERVSKDVFKDIYVNIRYKSMILHFRRVFCI